MTSLASAPPRGLAPWLLVAFAAGCAGPLPRAEAQFADGDYPDAKQSLAALEAESGTWDDGKRAEYALYRGLTHAALGDREQADAWLRKAKAIEEAHAGSLSHEDAQRLKVALESNEAP
jgi:hypothetical protein